MKREYIIEPCTATSFFVKKGGNVIVEDMNGGQVADFFAEAAENGEEFLSTGVTIDVNRSIKLKKGDIIYTDRYRPMFTLVADDVGAHDILHPSCRREMYDFFYNDGAGHPTCLDNIDHAMKKHHPEIRPVNLFMNTKIAADGSVKVLAPKSLPGDRVVLRAEMDAFVGISACSVHESACNDGECSSIKVYVED